LGRLVALRYVLLSVLELARTVGYNWIRVNEEDRQIKFTFQHTDSPPNMMKVSSGDAQNPPDVMNAIPWVVLTYWGKRYKELRSEVERKWPDTMDWSKKVNENATRILCHHVVSRLIAHYYFICARCQAELNEIRDDRLVSTFAEMKEFDDLRE